MNRWGAVLGITIMLGGCAHKAASTAETKPAEEKPKGPTVATWAKGAFVMPNLGTYQRKVSTTNAEAQSYFDQGLRLVFGFNHDEATRSFAKAAELDPNCASCFWGVALTLGPNYNVPMLPDRATVAWEALQKAQALAAKATPVEQALIGALSKRYKSAEPVPPPAFRPLSVAYAEAMREVAKKFPDDLDVQTLFAESLMDIDPWMLWTADAKPTQYTPEILATLEAVMKKAPDHPGANHYYIHAIEASSTPEKGLPSADKLAGLMPGAGHIVHMPAHIFQRVGRYEDACATNRKAIEVDQAYMKATTPPGYYPMYLAHNAGFLSYASSMIGHSEEAMTSARTAAKAVPPPMLDMMPGMDYFTSAHLFVMVRFGKWDQLLAEPRPPEKYQVMTGLWLHGHGMALVSKGKLDDAAKDLAELTALKDKIPPQVRTGVNPARDVVAVGAKILEARLAEAQKKPNALALWQEAVGLEDKQMYSEPADWFYPARHFQGAALLAAKKAKEAEVVFREDQKRNPENGWSLYGLELALKAQKKNKDAAAVDKRFQKVWSGADVKLTTSIIP